MANFNEVEKRAEATLKEAGVFEHPVNPIAVANALGYKVYAVKFRDGSFSGRMLLKNGDVRIDVNAYDPPNRRRFTIAHEIGHALMHTEGYTNLEIPDRVNENAIARQELVLSRAASHDGPRPIIEAQADRFAAALLMPRAWIESSFEMEKDVSRLAKEYGVSEAAMDIRLKQLHLV